MADGGCHSSHLAVAALRQLQREPAVGNVPALADRRVPRRQFRRGIQPPSAGGSHGDTVELQLPRGEAPERGVFGLTLDLYPVFAAVAARRVQQALESNSRPSESASSRPSG